MNIDELPVSDEAKAALRGYTLTEVNIDADPVYRTKEPAGTGYRRVTIGAHREVAGATLTVSVMASYRKPKTPREILEAWPHGYGTSRLPGDAPGDPPRHLVRMYDDRGNVEWYTAEHPTEEAAIAEAAAWCRGNRP